MMVNKYMHSQKGLSLLELLLAITVIVGLLTAASVIFNDLFKGSIDRKAARETQQLQSAAADYVQLNLDSILTNNIPAIGNAYEISIAAIVAEGFLPLNYDANNSYKQSFRVFARKLDENTINGDIIEVITLSEGKPMPDRRLFNAASNAEPSVGIISNLNLSATCCNGNIQSLSGSWSIPLNVAYFGATIFPTLPNPGADGGYLAAYDIVSQSDNLTSNYLFRSKTASDPSLNKMETDLILNNTSITDAGYIVADSMNIGGNATFNGLEPDGATTSPYVLATRDDFTVGNSLNVTDGGSALKGNITIEGDEGFGVDFNVSNVMTINNNATGLAGNVSAANINTDNISIVNSAQFGNLNNNNTTLRAGNIYTINTNFSNSLSTDVLQVINSDNIDTLDTDTAVAGTVNITDSAGLSIPPTIDVGNNAAVGSTINTNSIDVNETATITTMSNCTSGCP